MRDYKLSLDTINEYNVKVALVNDHNYTLELVLNPEYKIVTTLITNENFTLHGVNIDEYKLKFSIPNTNHSDIAMDEDSLLGVMDFYLVDKSGNFIMDLNYKYITSLG